MTKIKILSLIIVTIFLFGCTDTEDFWNEYDGIIDDTVPTEDCNTAQQNLATALASYNNSNPEDEDFLEICNNYKVAIQNYISLCSDPGGTYADILAELSCVQSDMTCEEATAATSDAAAAYNAAEAGSEEAYNNCMAYREALITQIDICGDESGALQSTLDGLTCTPPDQGGETATGSISLTAGTAPMLFNRDITYIINETNGTVEIHALHETSDTYYINLVIEQGVTGDDVIDNITLQFTSLFTPSTVAGTPTPYTDSITTNDTTSLAGTFYGDFINADNASLSITNGVIDIQY